MLYPARDTLDPNHSVAAAADDDKDGDDDEEDGDDDEYEDGDLAKSSLRSRISSSAVHWADKTVKPQMSANRILTWVGTKR